MNVVADIVLVGRWGPGLGVLAPSGHAGRLTDDMQDVRPLQTQSPLPSWLEEVRPPRSLPSIGAESGKCRAARLIWWTSRSY